MRELTTDQEAFETRFRNALTEILREIDLCPDDNLQDIANEMLERWKVGFRVDSNYADYTVKEE